MQAKFIDYIKKEDLFHHGDKLIVAVSGGVDSVVLAELCHRAGYDFMMAHCNFNLRKDEVENEKNLVEKLAEKLKVEVLVKEFDTENFASENKLSIQVAARELRYAWFHELLKKTGRRYILTAHHADDNIETLLMNFFKGTGIHGLKAILPKKDDLVRPLLFAKKTELEEFAKEQALEYATDSSNLSDKYSRNYLRHHIIPLVQQIYPAAENSLTKNIDRFREIETLYEEAVDLHKKKLLEFKGDEIHIPVLKLAKVKALHSVVYEIIKDHGFTSAQVHDVVGLLKSDSGKYVDSSSHRILKNRNWIIIAKKNSAEARNILVEEDMQEVEFGSSLLRIKMVDAKGYTISKSASIAQLDASFIKFPLILRQWKQGDYFYPLGMLKKKNLSRLLIDLKLSKNDKEKVWVVEMDKKILWVVGYRIDERFKLTKKSSKVITIGVLPTN